MLIKEIGNAGRLEEVLKFGNVITVRFPEVTPTTHYGTDIIPMVTETGMVHSDGLLTIKGKLLPFSNSELKLTENEYGMPIDYDVVEAVLSKHSKESYALCSYNRCLIKGIQSAMESIQHSISYKEIELEEVNNVPERSTEEPEQAPEAPITVFVCVIDSYYDEVWNKPFRSRKSAKDFFKLQTGFEWEYFQVLLTTTEAKTKEEIDFVCEYRRSYIEEVELK